MLNLISKIFYKKKSKEIYLIDSEEHFDFLRFCLEKEKYLGLDTEFEWRSTYYPILSLLQIATLDKIFLVDCIKCKNLKWLKKILENKKKLIIFHSSRSDTTVLSSNLGIKINNVFDIQIAEKIINGGEVKNYGSIVKNYFPITLEKTQTNSNWLRRPFSQNQLSYASDDVHFLIEIYKKQLKILIKMEKEDEVLIKSKKEASQGNQELYVSRIKKLKKASKLAKEVFLWREKNAESRNITTSKIFKDKHLNKIVKSLENKNLDKNLLDRYFIDVDLASRFLKEIKK